MGVNHYVFIRCDLCGVSAFVGEEVSNAEARRLMRIKGWEMRMSPERKMLDVCSVCAPTYDDSKVINEMAEE